MCFKTVGKQKFVYKKLYLQIMCKKIIMKNYLKK